MDTRKRLPLVVGGLVLLPALVVALLPGGGAAAAEQGAAAGIPDRMAGYSYLTGDVSSAPPGRAVALFQHGWGVEFMDFPQAVAVGGDDDVYRRVDLAEDRAGPESQGDPAPMLLSPEGTRVVVGDHDSDRLDLAVQDLATGEVTSYPLPEGRSAVPVAWSPDGRLVAYLAGDAATNPYSGTPVEGDVSVLDVSSGEVRALAGATQASTAAFSPDGSELAVQHSAPAGGTLAVFGLADGARRDLALPAGHQLGGAEAWSPDGALLATSRAPFPCLDVIDEAEWTACQEQGGSIPDVIDFVAATGEPTEVPRPVDEVVAEAGRVLGWASAREVVVLAGRDRAEGSDPDEYWVTRVSLDDGATERLSAVPTGGGNYGVGRFQLAAGLVPELDVRAAGEPDRGRWPVALRVTMALLAAAAAGLLASVLARRARRR
ncbi:WD40 repeat domain-containing protein [Modestobacter sp. VKM Ac-2979]|uniref:WD40 repeat domain-containing protein n=1 Tax=unclassified Modestobacter TaxID=2643866 RepID=UPI0022AB7109|nr:MULTISPECIES: WD40 repeat domain-containing protein [unclassified Modestobacter]MCZ2811385.1 WD40 repeat domain-containing protein [Modestobacter sp. VKM Ac-2979]MCZ2840898.1 WD40 repeat domain-containing protein [Modestobacter sp. VKM Ac-2980]